MPCSGPFAQKSAAFLTLMFDPTTQRQQLNRTIGGVCRILRSCSRCDQVVVCLKLEHFWQKVSNSDSHFPLSHNSTKEGSHRLLLILVMRERSTCITEAQKGKKAHYIRLVYTWLMIHAVAGDFLVSAFRNLWRTHFTEHSCLNRALRYNCLPRQMYCISEEIYTVLKLH